MTAERIAVRSWQTREDAAQKYAGALAHDAQLIRSELAADPELRARMAGRSWHVGNGYWLSVCGACDAYSLTDGAMPAWANLGPHMVSEHGSQVAGINVGMLA